MPPTEWLQGRQSVFNLSNDLLQGKELCSSLHHCLGDKKHGNSLLDWMTVVIKFEMGRVSFTPAVKVKLPRYATWPLTCSQADKIIISVPIALPSDPVQ